MVNPKELLPEVERIVQKAGAIVLSYFHKQLPQIDKDNNSFVTEADIATENFLIEQLKKVLPEASFFAEESGVSGDGDYSWVIDPIDGTTNFAHGLPYFCISVALAYKTEPLLGVVYVPLVNELFWAIKGEGAFLNGHSIHVSSQTDLSKSFLLVGFPYKREDKSAVFEDLEQLSDKIFSFRHLGAVVLDQVYVACGRADGMFFEKLAWWDIAAGKLIIEEAGGLVTTYEGERVGIDYESFVAANKTLHRKLFDLLAVEQRNIEKK